MFVAAINCTKYYITIYALIVEELINVCCCVFSPFWPYQICITIHLFNSYDLLCYSFGKRTGSNARRPNECFVLEPSEMLVVSDVFFSLLLVIDLYTFDPFFSYDRWNICYIILLLVVSVVIGYFCSNCVQS